MLVQTLLLSLWLVLVQANTEKVIFRGPPSEPEALRDGSDGGLSRAALRPLPRLTPSSPRLRTFLPASFPTTTTTTTEEAEPDGQASWFLLAGLTAGQRYETRVCWSARQPTRFRLDVFTLADLVRGQTGEEEKRGVVGDQGPAASLHAYRASLAGLDDEGRGEGVDLNIKAGTESDTEDAAADALSGSVLLLRVLVAAEYVTDVPALRQTPPPVYVDVILDPFVWQVLPRSLVPTVAYAASVVPLLWMVARWVSGRVMRVGGGPVGHTKVE